jgi:mRNA interferase MazF
MMTSSRLACGDVWFVDFGRPISHEQGFRRPALVVSVDAYTQGPAALAVVVPLTRRDKAVRWQVPIRAPEAGLAADGFVKCDDVRSVSIVRFGRYVGQVTPSTLRAVEDRLRILLDL